MLQNELRELLLTTLYPSAPASGNKMVLTKCRFCGDSKNPRSMHFYISLGSEDTPPMYYCHKCHTGGILKSETLNFMGIFSVDIGVRLNNSNKKILANPKNKKYIDLEKYFLKGVHIISDKDNRLEYINNRLGTNLNLEDMYDLKIVFNLIDLLKLNNINELTRDPNVVRELSKYFIGFISQDNAFLNMRNLNPGNVIKTIDKKYVNYNIFGKQDNSQRMYVIPTNIDMNRRDRIKIHIAEGPFDILSIYLNLRQRESHSIYTAICGSGYLNAIKNFIIRMKLCYIEIHIYKDNDIDDYIIENIANILYPYQIPLYMHINAYPNEKDFGVPLDRIYERVIQLL